jgi:Ca2+-binding RTX toxin-like protein
MRARPDRAGSHRFLEGAHAARSPNLARRAALALATLAVATMALAARADAYVYWAAYSPDGQETPAVGRANLDGSNPNQTFITGADWGITGPYGLAVDLAPDIEGNKYVYWTVLFEPGSAVNGAIGRAPVDGTGTPQNFIPDAGFGPPDVAVGGGFIYWSIEPRTDVQRPGTIGRAILPHLEGYSQDFVQPLQSPFGIAIDGTYIYWADRVPLTEGATPVSTIGRARLDGQDSPNERWLVAASANESWSDVAVDARHVYWASATSSGGAIGRARLNGSGAPTAVNPDYITATNPAAVAVDATHIYWSNLDPNTRTSSIASANLNATNVQQNLIPLSTGITVNGLAVDAGPSACAGEAATIAGTGRSDTLRGTDGDDVIAARGGDDTVSARGGDDLVCGAGGADVIRGGRGDDRLRGGRGDDRLRGGTGNDVMLGGASDDRLVGGAGRDLLRGASGADRLVSRERRAAGQARVSDRVDCGPGRPDLAVADRRDHVKRCERVRLGRDLTRYRRPEPCPAAEAWARITQSFTEPLAGAQGVAAADRLCAARSS